MVTINQHRMWNLKENNNNNNGVTMYRYHLLNFHFLRTAGGRFLVGLFFFSCWNVSWIWSWTRNRRNDLIGRYRKKKMVWISRPLEGLVATFFITIIMVDIQSNIFKIVMAILRVTPLRRDHGRRIGGKTRPIGKKRNGEGAGNVGNCVKIP